MKKLFKLMFCSFFFISDAYPIDPAPEPTASSITDRLEIVGYWDYAPEVYNCYDSPYEKEELNAAIKFWQNQGFIFGAIHNDYNCIENYPSKGIVIESADASISKKYPTALAVTITEYNVIWKTISFANIKILVKKNRVLEHEIGHALGFMDCYKDNHIMNNVWENGGWKTDGLFVNQKI